MLERPARTVAVVTIKHAKAEKPDEECSSTNKQKGGTVRIEYAGKQLTMGTEVSSIHDDAGKETSHERDRSVPTCLQRLPQHRVL